MASTAAPEAPAARTDALLDGQLAFAQPARGYRAAIDPVLLAAALPEQRAGAAVLDAGCGAGAALLCLAWRQPQAALTGLELQPDLAELARANIQANGLAGQAGVVAGDLAAPPADARGPFHAAIANPPYGPAGESAPPAAGKARAVQEGALDLAGWLQRLAELLAPKGRLAMIQRADRLDTLLAAGERAGLGELAVLPLWPRAGAAAKRVIVTARKGVRGGAQLAPGLTLHEADGAFTPAAAAILRDGAGIPAAAWGR